MVSKIATLLIALLVCACSKEASRPVLSIDDYVNDKALREAEIKRCSAMKGDSDADPNCKNVSAASSKVAAKAIAESFSRPVGGGTFPKSFQR